MDIIYFILAKNLFYYFISSLRHCNRCNIDVTSNLFHGIYYVFYVNNVKNYDTFPLKCVFSLDNSYIGLDAFLFSFVKTERLVVEKAEGELVFLSFVLVK